MSNRNQSGKGKGKGKGNKGSRNKQIMYALNKNQIYVCIVKCLGNCRFKALSEDGSEYTVHVRGAMSGKNKRFNMVTAYSLVLIDTHEDLTANNAGDIIYIYNNADIELLLKEPKIKLSNLMQLMKNKSVETEQHKMDRDDGLDFKIDGIGHSCPIIAPPVATTSRFWNIIEEKADDTEEKEEEINIDFI